MSILNFYNFKNKKNKFISKITLMTLLVISYKSEIHCILTDEILIDSLSNISEDYHLLDYSFLPKKNRRF